MSMKNNWISVEKRLPEENGGPLLLRAKWFWTQEISYWVAHYNNRFVCNYRQYNRLLDDGSVTVTHWQPIEGPES